MYRAPLEDLRFVLHELLGDALLSALPAHAEYTPDLADAVLDEAARLAEEVIAPLRESGDREGAHWSPEGVTMPAGFKAAYRKFAEGGWVGLRADPGYGGQGVPIVLGAAVQELWAGANLAFKLGPMLTQGAIEALSLHGSPEQKARFLPKLISGEWSGTMNLTEPQAGSDLAAIRARALPEGDRYRIFGQKIFITYGEHDCTDNIIHMVLARIDGAPPGVRGISMFIVPKVGVRADGTLGERNEVRCLKVEDKLGIHASPTCVMQFGEEQGALGDLLGEANHGLEHMFVMMNAARLSVGLEGYAMAERAFQQALGWAHTRVQGKPPVAAPEGPAPIVHHPDVKRMLLTMKASVEAMRALALYAAFQLDLAEAAADAQVRSAARARGSLLIPIVKGWCTETGVEVTSLGVQVHGGMGYIEETGAAQSLRDARITPIYEGTTGIQANDLVGRKLGHDRGEAMTTLLAEATRELEALDVSGEAALVSLQCTALEGLQTLRLASESMLQALAVRPERAAAVSVPYLKLCGTALGGWLMTRSAAIASARLASGPGEARRFLEGKRATACFYGAHILPQSLALARIVAEGATAVVETDAALL